MWEKANKKIVEDKLKAVSENYRQRVSERLAIERPQLKNAVRSAIRKGERHHLILAEIYRSPFSVDYNVAVAGIDNLGFGNHQAHPE